MNISVEEVQRYIMVTHFLVATKIIHKERKKDMWKKKTKLPYYMLLENQPRGTDEVIPIWKLTIPDEYKKSTPCEYKMERCENRYKKFGYLDKPLTVIAEVNERSRKTDFILVDGYTRYLFAKYTKHFIYVPIKYITYDEYFAQKEKSEASYLARKESEKASA